MKKIYDLSDKYCKVATLLGDMAHRAMYSIIPGGRFDVTAARWVAQGAVDIIYYGTKTVMEELRHYKGDSSTEYKNHYLEAPTKENIDNYITILEKSEKIYNEEDNWHSAYGGKSWAKIAASLANIAKIYKQLLQIKRNSEEEEGLLRRMTVALNVFDGLCHNTGSIYNKMIVFEGRDDVASNAEVNERQEKVERIRDLSELKDPKHLYKEVADIVYPKRIYKDYETNLRSSPGFSEREDIEPQVKDVRRQKAARLDLQFYLVEFKKIIRRLNKIADAMRVADFEKSFSEDEKYTVMYKIRHSIFRSVNVELESLDRYLSNNSGFNILSDKNGRLNELKKKVQSGIKKLQATNDMHVKIIDNDKNIYINKGLLDICDKEVAAINVLYEEIAELEGSI